MPAALAAMLIDSVGTSTGDGGFRSPTDVPVGESDPAMQIAHLAGIAAGRALAQRVPGVVAYAESTAGAATLLLVVNRAGCPISKGVLSAGGWTLVQTGTTDAGYRLYGIRHTDGREIGLPVTVPADTEVS
jgi:hypothetical protein